MENLIFMGTPDFAVPTLKSIHESRHKISAVVTNIDKRGGRGRKLIPPKVKQVAENLGYDIIQPEKLNSIKFLDKIKSLNPSLIIVVAFKKLPRELYEIPDYGAVNIHASLLPKYRGAAPIHHAILNGEKQTGLTTFKINERIDTGKIINQRKIKIMQDDTTGSLWAKLSNLGGSIILETIDCLEKNSFNFKIQENQKATNAPKIKPEDLRINWENSAEKIHNQIRAFSPKPGAYSILNGKRIKFFNSSVNYQFEINKKNNPGYIYSDKNSFTIITGNGALEIFEIQPEGKSRMGIKNYLAGNRIVSGTILQ